MTGAYVFAAFIFFIFLYVFATLFTIFKKKIEREQNLYNESLAATLFRNTLTRKDKKDVDD